MSHLALSSIPRNGTAFPDQAEVKTSQNDVERVMNISASSRDINLPDKHCYILDGPSHDTAQMLTSRECHNLVPCQGFVSTILNHTSDREK